MSVVVFSLLVGAGAASLGVWWRRRARARAGSEVESASPAVARTGSGLELAVGDVVSIRGEELWLEQGWLVSEAGRAVAGVFEAREGVVVEFASPRREHFRATSSGIEVPTDAPMALELGGVRYERVRRLPIELDALGESRPLPWKTGLFFEYRSLSGDLLLVIGQAPAYRAWVGSPLPDGALERWGSAG